MGLASKRSSAAIFSLAVALLAPGLCRADLIGLYQFDDPSNLGKDTSGHANNATNNGGIFSASGYQGGAVSLDGRAAFLQVPINVDPSALPQMTWGAWVLPTATDPIRAILSADNAGFDRDIDIDNRGGSTSYSTFTGAGVLASGVSPSTANWTFVAAVYNQSANSMTFYVNGQSFNASTFFSTSETFFDIGSNPTFGQFFSGLVDNVFVYNQALTAAQVADIRANGFSSGVPEPAGLALLGLGGAGLIALGRRRGAGDRARLNRGASPAA